MPGSPKPGARWPRNRPRWCFRSSRILRRAARNGRPPHSILIMPGVLAVVGRSKAEAEDKYERLQSLIHPELGVAYLSEMLGTDVSSYPLDGPLPEVPLTNSQQGRQKVIVEMARREGLTIRQLYQRV